MKRFFKVGLLVSLLSCSMASNAVIITAEAMLDYAQEVSPSNPVPSSAMGFATLEFDTTSLTVDIFAEINGIFLSDITFPSGGLAFGNAGPFHIHNAPFGANGGVVVPFNLESFFTNTATGVEVSAMNVPFDAALVSELEAGNLYLNLHTLDYGSGEIRGQLSTVVAPAGFGLLIVLGLLLGGGRRTRGQGHDLV